MPSVLYRFVACLLLLLIDEPWCCRVDYAMLPCPDLGVLPTCTWSIRLALGCPTLRSGTWFPNTSTWYLVGTRLPHISSWHMCAQHVFRSIWLYISFDLAGRASSWLWYYVTTTIYTTSFVIWWLHVMHYGHIILRVHDSAELCVYFINVIHYIPRSSTWRLSSTYIVTVWTWVHWHTCWSGLLHAPFHVYIVSTLFVSTMSMSWRYSIICSSSSSRLMVLSVSTHRYVEPFVISWLYGSPVIIWSHLWWLCA